MDKAPKYWVVAIARDGSESTPDGPYECREVAKRYAQYCLTTCNAKGTFHWVGYEIQMENNDE
jgi:hypothetical protein